MKMNSEYNGDPVEITDDDFLEHMEFLDSLADENCVSEDTPAETAPDEAEAEGTLNEDEAELPDEGEEPDEDDGYDPLAKGYISQRDLSVEMSRQKLSEDAKYTQDTHEWVVFDEDTGYEVDRKKIVWNEVAGFIDRCTDRLIDDTPDDAKSRAATARRAEMLGSSAYIHAVERMCRNNPDCVSNITDFDAEKFVIGSPGGTIELKTGNVRPPLREEMITKKVSVAPADHGDDPVQFLKFLNEVFEGDQDRISLMKRAFGCAVTGLARERMFFILHGEGGDGKSTLLGIIENVMGVDYARQASIDTFVEKVGQSHPTELADLRGARFVFASEPPEGSRMNTALLKKVTGNERLTARYMRGNNFTFDVTFTIFLSMNKLLDLKTVDKAIRDRVVIIPFNRSFTDGTEDKHLMDRISGEEGPQIMRWIMDGAMEYLKDGVQLPEIVKEASSDYLDGEDVVGHFLKMETEPDPDGWVASGDIFERFKEFTEKSGEKGWTQTGLSKDLKSRKIKQKRIKLGRGFEGIRLLSENESHDRKNGQ